METRSGHFLSFIYLLIKIPLVVDIFSRLMLTFDLFREFTAVLDTISEEACALLKKKVSVFIHRDFYDDN